jgi:hypothetical protein
MFSVDANGFVRYRFAQNAAGAGTHARTKAGSIMRYRKLA